MVYNDVWMVWTVVVTTPRMLKSMALFVLEVRGLKSVYKTHILVMLVGKLI